MDGDKMGEIRIKSGNLFDTSLYTNDTYIHNCTVTNTSTSVTITSTGTDPFVGFVNSPGTTVPERAQLMYIPVKPNTTYTINMSSAPKCYCTQVDESNVIKKNTQINRLPYSFTADKSTTYVIIRLGDDTLQVGESRTFENIQLLEGTYTSETIPEYQPYFLNRPAHQFINGEWVDIPTHHFINGRWQGELTSQSPLRFRADGEMLDWRIEGRTSGNLYAIPIGEDLWGDNVSASHQNNDGELVVVMGTGNDSGVYSRAGSTINAVHSQLSTGSWSVEIKADSPMNLRLGFQADGVQYIDITNEYQKFTFSNQIFNSGSAFIVYNRTGVAHTVYLRNFMLNEGSTAHAYEPYGGVGDFDETEQKYKIPVRVEGENLFDANSSSVDGYIDDNGNIRLIPGYPIKTYDYINIIKDTDYTLVFNRTPSASTMRIAWYDDEYNFIKRYVNSAETYVIKSPSNASYCRLSIDVGLANIRLLEGSYTIDTLPPYEVNLYTDHQLMDGDSIDYTTTETTIPLATGNNILTIDTAVQPKSVFVKFEG